MFAAHRKTSSVTLEVIIGPQAGKHTLRSDNGCNYSEKRKPSDIEANLSLDSKGSKALAMLRTAIVNITGAQSLVLPSSGSRCLSARSTR